MKKIIRLTESDLTRIIGRVIRENEEQQMTDEITSTILNNISKEDLLTLGKMFNSLGEDEFKDVAEDVVDGVVENENVSESIGLSKKGVTYDTESEKNKIEVRKIITRVATTILALLSGSISIGAHRNDDFESSMVAGIIASAMVGANLLTRIPHRLNTKPISKKLQNSRMAKIVDNEMKTINPREMYFRDIVEHFEDKGFPQEVVNSFIVDWLDKNNVKFKEEKRVIRVK